MLDVDGGWGSSAPFIAACIGGFEWTAVSKILATPRSIPADLRLVPLLEPPHRLSDRFLQRFPRTKLQPEVLNKKSAQCESAKSL